MKYVGLHSVIQRNNTLSVLLLLGFPAILLGAVYLFFVILGDTSPFMSVLPWVLGAVAIWFAIAYFSNTSMIRHAVRATPLARRDNPRVYNIVENLTMACGMPMPEINIVNDSQLNAFASGINEKTYTVTVTTGLLDRLDDDELAGVIGHELTHIRNKDTQLLITSIVFVGIISVVMTIIVRLLWNTFLFGGGNRRSSNSKNNGASIIVVMVVALVCAAIAYLFTMLTRFAISRKREFMADAGGAELCGNPLALASALRKISNDPGLADVERDDIAQMYIVHPQALTGGVKGFFSHLFSTHPDTKERIRLLEQY
ncbi:MAG: M48 family metallopeptidase [Prevotella sp.]|nr:M48 family metallopeptidase [Prevotella sp.]